MQIQPVKVVYSTMSKLFMKKQDPSNVQFVEETLQLNNKCSNMFLQFMKEIGHLHVKFVMMSDLEESKA